MSISTVKAMAKARIVLRKDLVGTNDVRPSSKKAAIVPDGKDRLNLQVDEELKKWAQTYAKENHTSLTQIITDFFITLKKEKVDLEMDSELREWAIKYAKEKRTTISQLVTDYFMHLRKQEDGEGVEQI